MLSSTVYAVTLIREWLRVMVEEVLVVVACLSDVDGGVI